VVAAGCLIGRLGFRGARHLAVSTVPSVQGITSRIQELPGLGFVPGRLYGAGMAGAGSNTRQVAYVNANWMAPDDGSSTGTFELLIVTDDDRRHTIGASPEGINTVMMLIRAGTVLLWDDDARTLIVANIVGSWLPAPDSAVA
jgi:hypothetical protein